MIHIRPKLRLQLVDKWIFDDFFDSLNGVLLPREQTCEKGKNMTNLDQLSVNSIRILAADQVQKANSGHPGAPLGTAPMLYELWTNHMSHNPANPSWENRDRFILSGGHGSAGYYALLHLFGYGLSMDDLKNFRQYNSLTPGHPEYRHTPGVECTTGPLGSGLAAGVGMAMAEEHLASIFNKPGYPIVDHYTFVECGDGDLMEGVAQEALSLCGTLALDKMIILYDSNRITIEGSTDPVFREDVLKRMEALGFQTLEVEDGTDLEAISKAIEAAKANKEKPSFIKINTEIGYGSPKQGNASSHGEPLEDENVTALKTTLAYPSHEPFFVPDEVYANFETHAAKGKLAEEEWNRLRDAYYAEYPEMKELFERYQNGTLNLEDLDESYWEKTDKKEATRASSGKILNKLKDLFPMMVGGSADLGPSNKTYMNGAGDFTVEDRSGRNLHFGVREIGMGGICNGLALHGLRPYAGTFFVFSDYAKPMVRLASLMQLPVIYVYSHDSIGVGEDGPTHQPVEHLASYRSIPNITVFRPADQTETAAGWAVAMASEKTPTALILTRQNVDQIAETSKEAMKGGYILSDSEKETPDAILIASGSEVKPCMDAKKLLREQGVDVRVVSMPSIELFERQPEDYKNAVLPRNVKARVVVEASKDFGWGRYVGLDGAILGMESFGASAPGSELFDIYGFKAEPIAATVNEVIARCS